ncbi:hypothetical protein Mapa_006082 [Marchantia paleacea]|nr:hypothetical protein Mapa_006082 [Marchantia paleacea]
MNVHTSETLKSQSKLNATVLKPYSSVVVNSHTRPSTTLSASHMTSRASREGLHLSRL